MVWSYEPLVFDGFSAKKGGAILSKLLILSRVCFHKYETLFAVKNVRASHSFKVV